MPFFDSTFEDGDKASPDLGFMQNILSSAARADPRGCYYIQPTWRINELPSPTRPSLDPFLTSPVSKKARFEKTTHTRRLPFRELLRHLSRPELREVIMNASLRDFDAHRDVVRMLKNMQARKPRSISNDVKRPVAGLYLYCRSQKELVDIVLELERNDTTGNFKRDITDLIMVMKEKTA
ncbi:hypothetical protein F5Y18DRAFT_427052 [Xylariaceae sp. FL1019]|nr:hypothetical protein F5Y18DRAFT_427052 [Xylariaceae sp. FL1019]